MSAVGGTYAAGTCNSLNTCSSPGCRNCIQQMIIQFARHCTYQLRSACCVNTNAGCLLGSLLLTSWPN
jgi:hypothetical protein